jgi:hypothetical protein
MRKAILLSAVIGPILLGLIAATDRRPKRGLARLAASVALFEFAHGLVLYYVWLRLSD